MKEKKPNIEEMISALEGKHDYFPKGILKKIQVKELSKQQIEMISYHYHNSFGEATFMQRTSTSEENY